VGLGTDFVVSGKLAGTSTNPAGQTLTKAGSGLMKLTNDNVGFTGNITLAQSGGIVQVTHARALGGGTGFTTVNTNSTLQIGNVVSINENVILNGSGVTGTGALYNLAGNTQWLGKITLDSNAAIGAATGTVLTINSEITDTASGHD